MLKEKRSLIFITILLYIILLFIITPFNVSKSYNGINFDFNNDKIVKTVTVNINGVLKRDLMLRPKTFEGTILIDSNKFEITDPISLSPIPYGNISMH